MFSGLNAPSARDFLKSAANFKLPSLVLSRILYAVSAPSLGSSPAAIAALAPALRIAAPVFPYRSSSLISDGFWYAFPVQNLPLFAPVPFSPYFGVGAGGDAESGFVVVFPGLIGRP